MSDVHPFYNLDDLTQGALRQISPDISTRIFIGDQAMLSVVAAEPGARSEIHSHAEEQWGVMLDGDGVRIQGGEEFAVKAGDFWRTPGGVAHGFVAGPNGARILDIFSPPRAAYKDASAATKMRG